MMMMMSMRLLYVYVAYVVYVVPVVYGSNHLGAVDIDNEGLTGDEIDENCIQITFLNECENGISSLNERVDALLSRFPCLDLIDGSSGLETFTYPGNEHSYLFLDCSDSSCMDNDLISLDDLCIEHVSNDHIVQLTDNKDYCFNSDDDPNLPYSWALDELDGIMDDTFSHYFGHVDSINVYVMDTGILSTHEDFYIVDDLYGSGYNSGAIDGDHGTHVASTLAGFQYGVLAARHRIQNVRIFQGVCLIGGILVSCVGSANLGDAFVAIQQHLTNTGKRGVINMSFGGAYTVSGATFYNDHLQEIIFRGGIPVAAAGNSAADACGFLPAASPYAISVGAHDINNDIASFSNYGTCVDIYGPGVSVWGASTPNDDDYVVKQGTSMASPHIAGIIANWEVECQETNFHTPCTFNNHKERLKDYSEPVNGVGVRCGDSGVECEAAQYHCGCGFYPREVDRCVNTPCASYEKGLCLIYHNPPGCDQCINTGTNFKIDYNYPCVNCQSIFGNQCLGCNDFSGCCQCNPINSYTLVKDDCSDLWYCKPSPCLNPDNHCQVCNNDKCSQCVYPYTMNADQRSCD